MANFTIISSSPLNGAANVLLDSSIQIVTSVQLKPPSINTTSISISDTGNNRLDGIFSYSQHTNNVYGIITFSPLSPLKALETYKVEISSLLGINDETLASQVIISFTAGEILSKTLTTSDKISFFEKICYPQDGSNIASWSKYDGSGIVESRYMERVTPGALFPIMARVISGNGTITPYGDIWVEAGRSETFSLSPATNYTLETVYIDGLPSIQAKADGEYTFSNVLRSHSIAAIFKHVPLDLLVGFSGPGSVSPTSISVDLGTNQVFNLTFGRYSDRTVEIYRPGPDITATTQAGVTSFVISNVQESENITVSFPYRNIVFAGESNDVSRGYFEWTTNNGAIWVQQQEASWEASLYYNSTVQSNIQANPGSFIGSVTCVDPVDDSPIVQGYGIWGTQPPFTSLHNFRWAELNNGSLQQDVKVIYTFIPGFTAKFSTDWWQAPITGTRTGNGPISANAAGLIVIKPNQAVNGTWNSGYRPRYMKLFYSGTGSVSLAIKDGNGVSTYFTNGAVGNGGVIDLAGQSGNIGRLYIQNTNSAATFDLTNIEFMD